MDKYITLKDNYMIQVGKNFNHLSLFKLGDFDISPSHGISDDIVNILQHHQEPLSKILEIMVEKTGENYDDLKLQFESELVNLPFIKLIDNIPDKIIINGNKNLQIPYQICIELTNKCNFKCIHCYNECSIENTQFFDTIKLFE